MGRNGEFDLSVNQIAASLVDALINDANQLKITCRRSTEGAWIVDAGVGCCGSFEAGRRIAEICMAGLGKVNLRSSTVVDPAWPCVEVTTSQPVISCLGSQYAGWILSYANGRKFNALGSGPSRALAQKEPLFEELNYFDEYFRTCMVIECSDLPPEGLIRKVAAQCSVEPKNLTVILTPTGSPAGVVQIAARVVEVALHKAHEMGFDLFAIHEGAGIAPLPPPTADPLVAMGRTNDSILFCGQVALLVDCGDDSAEQLARELPSSNSRDYGTPFAQKFADYDYDFFAMDPMLFSPAQVSVTEIKSGRTFFAGKVDRELLKLSFFGSS